MTTVVVGRSAHIQSSHVTLQSCWQPLQKDNISNQQLTSQMPNIPKMEEEPENLLNIIFPNGLPGTKLTLAFET